MTNKMQLCRIIYYSLAALHVSSDIFAHHQEHLNCITASGITHVSRCPLISWKCLNNTPMIQTLPWYQRASKLYYSFWYYTRMSLPAGIMGVFEQHSHDTSWHLNCITASGITHVCRCQLVLWECLNNTPMIQTLPWYQLASKLYYSFWYYTRMSLPAGIMGVFERHSHDTSWHLNCITASGITHVCRCQLVLWECLNNTPMIPAGI